jgi:hypothetical protein
VLDFVARGIARRLISWRAIQPSGICVHQLDHPRRTGRDIVAGLAAAWRQNQLCAPHLSTVIPLIVLNGESLAHKLEPREAVSFYMEKPTRHAGKPLTYAYARTSDDRMFKGSSPALKQHNA